MVEIEVLQAGAEAFARNWKDQCIACRESLKALDAAFARVLEEADPDQNTATIKITGRAVVIVAKGLEKSVTV